MAARKGQNMRDKFPEKLIRVHKHCKVASRNRHKFFSRCLNRFEIFPGKLRRCGEIFRSLEEKHRNCKFESELLHRFGPRLGDEAFSAQNLAIDRIVQISNGITGSDQSKSKAPLEESIRAFETVHPFALYAVALKSGYMEKHVLHETTDGTPQGGIISPALSNCALDGLERLLKEKFPTKKPLSSFGGKFPCVNLIRYADDFIITARTKELLEGEIKPLVEQFLQERGLELSPAKTVITHVEKGFDFLGQNVRKYPNGKLLIKPSKKNVKTFLGGIRKTIKAALGISAADLIHKLNPKIRGWANYHRHVVSQRTFVRVDHHIFSSLWRWARRRHPNKNTRWCKQKYFAPRRGRNWCFFGETCADLGQPIQVWLRHARSTPIKRHVKVQGDANPYDPAYETYFEQREATHMQETFRGTRTLRFLWHEQRGLCTVCNTPITRITGWRLHHCVPRGMGGSQSAENRVLLHPECHDRVHNQCLPVSKPRLPERGVRRA